MPPVGFDRQKVDAGIEKPGISIRTYPAIFRPRKMGYFCQGSANFCAAKNRCFAPHSNGFIKKLADSGQLWEVNSYMQSWVALRQGDPLSKLYANDPAIYNLQQLKRVDDALNSVRKEVRKRGPVGRDEMLEENRRKGAPGAPGVGAPSVGGEGTDISKISMEQIS